MHIFPPNDRDQEIRLKRFFIATGAHGLNLFFVFLCWAMNFLNTAIVMNYLMFVLFLNAVVFLTLRSGLNKRFADPSLTFLQISLAALPGLYVMYFAGEARGTFLLLGLAMFAFGLFRFKTRDFVFLAIVILTGYASLIALLMKFDPVGLKFKIELLQWMAFVVTLVEFSFLAGYIGDLRSKVVEKNQKLAIQNIELESALKRIGDLVVRDELTGVHNRRYLMERIREESQRSLRNNATFCIGMADIDFFKIVNDTYGHLAGDEVLRAVAQAGSACLRLTDCFGRFGGEEFVLVLSDTTLDGAMITAERVRHAVEALVFPGMSHGVTISIGVAEHVRKSDTAETLNRADAALYHAKEAGRNQCVAAPTIMEASV